MLIIEGEKWACDACIRGHRVSSCTHRDRKLNHVNKKGRPLTQCPHCRGLRKSRATHVKCECGELGHSRNSSVESASNTGEAGCKCMTGKKCSCALKKEPVDDNDSSASFLSRRPAPKPVLSLHRSDSAVPRIRAPHPPMQRLTAAIQPYTITRPRPISDALHMGQRSVDNSSHARSASGTQPIRPQPSTIPMGSRQYSNPVVSDNVFPPRRPPLPALRINNHSPLEDFSASVDQTFMNMAVSPGNPARYSFHGMSENNMGGLSRPNSDLFASNNDVDYPSNLHWPEACVAADFDDQSTVFNPNPLTPSDGSVEYSIYSQPGLSMSSSGPTSELGDGMHGNLPIRSMASNPSWNMQSYMDQREDLSEQEWSQYGPRYAASDTALPAYDMQNSVAMGGLEQPGMESNSYFIQTIDQRYPEGPMTADDAVREWVPNLPSMENPNVDFKFPAKHSMEQLMEQPLPGYTGNRGLPTWI